MQLLPNQFKTEVTDEKATNGNTNHDNKSFNEHLEGRN